MTSTTSIENSDSRRFAIRSYDRYVAICRLEGVDISATLVRQGLARDCPRSSGGRYREIEQAAVDRGATIRQIYRLPGYCEK